MLLKVIQLHTLYVSKTSRLDKIPIKHRKGVESQLLKISSIIQKKRLEMNLTQEQLAEKLDLAVLTIQAIEQGWRYPSLPVLFYMCKVMEIPFQLGDDISATKFIKIN